MSDVAEKPLFKVYNLVSPSGESRADIVPELGGIVSSLTLPSPDGPRECLYQSDWFWDPASELTRGGIPLLFPICGRLLKDGEPGRYDVDGQPYTLPIHGFAMRRPWHVHSQDRPDLFRLSLTDSAETRAMYPFAFELTLIYHLTDNGFQIGLTVHNTGSRPMPYYAGFHPYFLTPPPGAGKENVLFDATPIKRHLYNADLTDLVGTGPVPALPTSITNPSLNELLIEVGDKGLSRILYPDGWELAMAATGKEDPTLFRYRQYYTLPDQPFFCDEPWMSHPGAMNRPGAARILQAGQAESGAISIAVDDVLL